MPFIAQVALGQKPELTIFGGDYPTTDGTGIKIILILIIHQYLFHSFI